MVLDTLKSIVGGRGWTSDVERLEPQLTEWRGSWRGKTPLMLMPATTDETAAIVKTCAGAGLGIVPQGGNTGLCGGAIPDQSGKQILLSLSRMRRIRAMSADNYSMIAEAGCVLADLQRVAADAGRLFPLSLAAEGSCQIGGNLSTNAGGTNVLRYGTARDQVLGLEVVLADGRVIDGLRSLRKDTAGYDLKQLFIGSEGTLGIITAASLRLFPPVPALGTAWFAVESPHAAVALLDALRIRLADQLQAFELISARALNFVLRHRAGARAPLGTDTAWHVLAEGAIPCGHAAFEDVLADVLDASMAMDAVVAKNASERDQFWQLRHAISEVQKAEGASLKHDVSVPVDAIGRFIDMASEAVLKHIPSARIVAFGHVGDGNVHFNVSQPQTWHGDEFLALHDDVASIVYDTVARFDGSFSAEHGVGVMKRDALRKYRSDTEVAVMRQLKQALDPRNILNPGKVL